MANLRHRPLDNLKLAAIAQPTGDHGLDVGLAQRLPARMLNFRADLSNAKAKQAAETAIGIALPTKAQQRSDDGSIWWLGPDEWMLTKPDRDAHPNWANDLRLSLDGHHISLVDVSHQYEGFRVDGPLARTLLAHVVTLDLHPRSMQANSVWQTVAAHCQIMLLVCADGKSFDVFTRRSFVTYIWQRLVDAAADMDLKVHPAV